VTTSVLPSLAEQSREIRERLQAQRQRIALQLLPVSAVADRFPRSLTMRVLIRLLRYV
jgi:hypothetical protein